MQECTHSIERSIEAYQVILSDLDAAIAAVQEQRLEALETVLPRLDACQGQIAIGGDGLPVAKTYAGDIWLCDRVAEARHLMQEILARSQKLAELIRTPMDGLTAEIAELNKNRLYLNSVTRAYGPGSPHMHLQA